MRFDPAWRAYDGIFGGYVIAMLVQSGACVEGYDPLSVSVQFMGAVRAGESEIQVDVVHKGAATAVVDLELFQGHRRASASVKLGRGPAERIIEQRLHLDGLERPEQIAPVQMPYGRFEYDRHFDVRLILESTPPQTERTRAWIRLATDKRGVGDIGRWALAALFLDALPPGLFFVPEAPVFVPTIDFTAHFAPPITWETGDWMFLTQHTRWATHDFCLEEAALYTVDGLLVAQGRQTRHVRWPMINTLAPPLGRRGDTDQHAPGQSR